MEKGIDIWCEFQDKWRRSEYHWRHSCYFNYAAAVNVFLLLVFHLLWYWSVLRSSIKSDSHIACRSRTVPMPCDALINTCHSAPLPCSDSAVSFVKVRMVAGSIRTASPTVWQVVFFVVCSYHSFPHTWQTVSGFTLATCIWDWYASDNNLRGTPRGSRKKPKAGR